jgi:hypothetical protein
MKTILVIGLMAGLLTVAPASAGTEGLCGPDGSDVHKRPGGYCDTVLGNGSLSLPASALADGVPLGMPTDEEEDDCACAAAS